MTSIQDGYPAFPTATPRRRMARPVRQMQDDSVIFRRAVPRGESAAAMQGSRRTRRASVDFGRMGMEVAGAAAGIFLLLQATHADMYLAGLGWLPLAPTAFFALVALPILGLLAFRDVVLRPGTVAQADRFTAALQAGLGPVLLLMGMVAYHLFPASLLPFAYWGEGATYILLPVYGLIVFLFGIALGSSGVIERRWRLFLWIIWAVLCGTILYELWNPTWFASFLSTSGHHGTQRPAGWVGDPNTAAFLVVMACALLLRPDRPGSGGNIALLTVSAVTVLATLSRGGLVLMLALGVWYWWEARPHRTARRNGVRRLVWATGLLMAVIAAPLFMKDPAAMLQSIPALSGWDTQGRLGAFTGSGGQVVAGDDDRVRVLMDYILLVGERPFIGFGSGFMWTRDLGAHNMFLYRWLENGLPGLFLYVGFLAACWFMYRRHGFVQGQALVVVGAAQSLFSHTLMDSRSFLILLGLAVGLAATRGLRSPSGRTAAGR